MSDTRLERARLSLEGLSVGDSFGEKFFMHTDRALSLIRGRALPKPVWSYTDDTNMALSIYESLRLHGEIDQDSLALSYAQHYHPMRGYGAAMHSMLAQIAAGEDWRVVAPDLFSGSGSYGNGAAMRVAPVGGYFADDLDQVVEQARRASEITHAHPEGIAGGIAVAVAAAQASRLSGQPAPSRAEFIDLVLPYVPDSEVKSGIRRARDVQAKDIHQIARMLGNGSQISAQDTVPFTLWCAGEKLDNFVEAMWQTVWALGDIDTNCAIVALYVGHEGIPADWIASREPLPEWSLG